VLGTAPGDSLSRLYLCRMTIMFLSSGEGESKQCVKHPDIQEVNLYCKVARTHGLSIRD
jgi:hypothetical protein